MKKHKSFIYLFLSLIALASCGGNGGGQDDPDPPAGISTSVINSKIAQDETISFELEVDEGEIEVSWGDGTVNNECSHTYSSASDDLTISITGKIISFNLSNEEGVLSEGNSRIDQIKIGEGIVSLPDYAFEGCSDLDRVLVPASVSSMGKEVFPDSTVYCGAKSQPQKGWDSEWAKNIVNHDVVWDVTQIDSDDNYYYAKTRESIYIEQLKKTEEKMVIPNEIDGLPVTVIGKRAFDGTTLKEIVFPDQLTAINDEAFKYCSNLATANLPSSLVSIGNNAFENTLIKEITMPNEHLVTVGNDVFKNCVQLAFIYCLDEEKPEGWAENWVGNNRSNVVWGYLREDKDDGYSFIETIKGAYITKYEGEYQSAFKIPNTLGEKDLPVINIGNGVFSNETAITSVTLPNKLEVIGNNAFSGCSELTTITFPDSLKSIGIESFKGCVKLTGVCLPDNLESIGDNAFYACEGIGEIIIPSSVSVIGGYAFDSCNAHIFCIVETKPTGWSNVWNEAYLGGSTKKNKIHWGYISKGETEDHIYEYMQMRNGISILKYKGTEVEELTVPKMLDEKTVIGIESNAFLYDEKLKTIHLTNSIKFIRAYAFELCYCLNQINIPTSVLNVGKRIFDDAGSRPIHNILSIYCEAKEKPAGWASDWAEGIISSICYWDSGEPIENEEYKYIVHSSGVEILSHLPAKEHSAIIVPSTIESKTVFRLASNSIHFSQFDTIAIPSQITEIGSVAFSIDCLNKNIYCECEAETKPTGWASDWVDETQNDIYWGFGNTKTVGGLDYTRSSQEAHVLCYRGESESVTVSESYDGKPVTRIAPHAFRNSTMVTSILLPNTIKTLGVSAFDNGTTKSTNLQIDLTAFTADNVPISEGQVISPWTDATIKISDASVETALKNNGWPKGATYEVVPQ